MPNMESLILLISILNVFLAGVMLAYNWKLNRNILFFAIFVFCIASTSVLYDIAINGGSPKLMSFVFHYNVALSFAFGPMLYFFTRGLLEDKEGLTKKDWWHFVPVMLVVLLFLPFYFTPLVEKWELMSKASGNLSYFLDLRISSLPIWTFNIVIIVSSVFYYIWSYILLYKFSKIRSKVINPNVLSQFTRTSRWLKVIIILNLLLTLMFVGLNMYAMVEPVDFDLQRNETLFTISTALNLVFPIMIFLNPFIMYGFPTRKQLHASVEVAQVVEPVYETLIAKIDKSETYESDEGLDYYEDLMHRIIRYLEEEQPYRKKGFDMQDIKMALNVPLHHLQFCFKNVIQKRFVQVRNEYRVAYALYLLSNEDMTRRTVDSIGEQAGFASSSVFYTSFKEIVGHTPSQWLRERSRT